jgi:hypothetical protein
VPGNFFGSECGVTPADAASADINTSDAAWGAAALQATRVAAVPNDGSSYDRSMQPAQLAVTRRLSAAFFAAHAAGRADAAPLIWDAGSRASPWLFADALTRLTAVK